MAGSGEKTEEATPRQLQKARERGEVSQSKDLTSAILLAVGFGVIGFTMDAAGPRFKAAAVSAFTNAASPDVSNDVLFRTLAAVSLEAAQALLPLFAAMFAFALFVPFLQVGALLTLDPLTPKLDKFNPVNGIKRMFFSMQTYVELLKSSVKIFVVGFICWKVVSGELRNVILSSDRGAAEIAARTSAIAGKCLTRVVLFFLLMAIIDFFYQRWQYNKKLRMSREEVKQEYKEQEGDPHHKAERHRQHQQLATQAMLHKVRKADVIVTNPDHIACALRYDPGSEDSPRLLGKGKGYLAEKIKEIAKEEDLPVVRDISLAHALYEMEEDEQIPEELFEAVAEVLRWVEQVLKAQGEMPTWLQPQPPKEGEGEAAET